MRRSAIDRLRSIVSGLPWFLTYTLDFYINTSTIEPKGKRNLDFKTLKQ